MRNVVIFICAFLIYFTAYCQDDNDISNTYIQRNSFDQTTTPPPSDIILDLADPASVYELSINPNENLTLEFINRILNERFRYHVRIYIENETIQPIEFPVSDFNMYDPVVELIIPNDNTVTCSQLDSLYKMFFNIDNEALLPDYLEKVRKFLGSKLEGDIDCYESMKLKDILRKYLSEYKFTTSIKKGNVLNIEVTRYGGPDKKTWKWIYKAPSRGSWQTTYGFNHLSYIFSKKEEYHIDDINGSNQILKSKINDWFEIKPTILFSWYPSQREIRNWSFGISGGLGIDLDEPSVLLGLGFGYNQNLNITVGLSSHQQQKLRGRYKENQVITDILSMDQLHENVYRLNPFVNISFHLSSNPFNKKEENDNEDNEDE